MTISKRMLVAVLAGFAALVTVDGAAAQVSVSQVEKAETVAELVALGATKLNAGQFKSNVVGQPIAGDGWTWTIDPDGTTSSAATDGSWAEDKAPWNMKGDAYCTPLEGAMACRDVYLIGSYMRMSDKADPAKLSDWTAKVGN